MDYKSFINHLSERIGNEFKNLGEPVLHKIIKNNTTEDGIYLKMSSGKKSPSLSLTQLYQVLKNGKPLADIRADTSEIFKQFATNEIFDPIYFSSFRNARYRIMYKLISYNRNGLLLQHIPHKKFLDLAIIYYILLEEHRILQVAPVVTNKNLEDWGISMKNLHQIALNNTQSLLPPIICHLSKVLGETASANMAPAFAYDTKALHADSPFYHLTNASGFNGAACILYNHVLEDFAARNASDIIILPCSIDEVILIPERLCRRRNYKGFVREVNVSRLPEEKILSDGIYRYSREAGRILTEEQGILFP